MAASRRFWAFVGVTLGLEAGASVLAWRAAHVVLPCVWAGSWALGWHPGATCLPGAGRVVGWAAPAVIGAVVGGSLVIAAAGAVIQGLRSMALVASLGRRAEPGARAGPERALWVRDDRPYAVCVGIVWPRVAISSGLVARLGVDELEAIVAHEARHAARRDPARALCRQVGRAACWFIPSLADLTQAALVEAELGADAVAVAEVGIPALAGALAVALEGVQARSAPIPLASSASVMASRVAALGGERPGFRWSRLRLVLSGLALGLLTGLAVISPVARPVPVFPSSAQAACRRIGASHCPTADDTIIRNSFFSP